jgi:hypothetical protein
MAPGGTLSEATSATGDPFSREEMDWVIAHRRELLRAYPEQWIAVSAMTVVAHSRSLAELRQLVVAHRAGRPVGLRVFVHYVQTTDAEFVPWALPAPES